jgi:mono/diheme cytochrome c family protein
MGGTAEPLPPPQPVEDEWLTADVVAEITEGEPALVDAGRKVYAEQNCAMCHTVPGEPTAQNRGHLGGWAERQNRIYNSPMLGSLRNMMARKDQDALAAFDRIAQTPEGPARLAVWVDETLDHPHFDKGSDWNPKEAPARMPSYSQLDRQQRKALLAYLFNLNQEETPEGSPADPGEAAAGD